MPLRMENREACYGYIFNVTGKQSIVAYCLHHTIRYISYKAVFCFVFLEKNNTARVFEVHWIRNSNLLNI